MTRLVLCLALAVLAGSCRADAALAPGRTLSNPSTISALGVTHRSVVYAVRETRDLRSCAYVVLWDTATRGLWRLGSSTTSICTEGLSTGSGISQVATSGRRVFWVTYAGGNVREEALWTATPTQRAPRRLADASADVDADARPIVLGPGTREGVAYATGRTLTYVADSGARVFRIVLPSEVRLLTTGVGPGEARVVAALGDGSVVTVTRAGAILSTARHAPGAVTAVALALPGPIVQAGTTIHVGRRSVELPRASSLLDFRQGRIVYARGPQVRARHVATGGDTLLRVVAVRPWERPLFATDAWGSAWATGSAVSWRSGPLA